MAPRFFFRVEIEAASVDVNSVAGVAFGVGVFFRLFVRHVCFGASLRGEAQMTTRQNVYRERVCNVMGCCQWECSATFGRALQIIDEHLCFRATLLSLFFLYF